MQRPWTGAEIKQLQVLLDEGLSYTGIAKRLGRSRGAISGAVRRHVQKIPDKRLPHHNKVHARIRTTAQIRSAQGWTERVLTETWAERKARQVG